MLAVVVHEPAVVVFIVCVMITICSLLVVSSLLLLLHVLADAEEGGGVNL